MTDKNSCGAFPKTLNIISTRSKRDDIERSLLEGLRICFEVVVSIDCGRDDVFENGRVGKAPGSSTMMPVL